jgi:hypothetical protein
MIWPQEARAVEFDIGIDQIVRPPTFEGMPDRQRHYDLEIGALVRIVFELCFMDDSVVEGRFPGDRVLVAFAARQTACGWEDIRANRMPVSFRWIGQRMNIVDGPKHAPEDRVPIYRLWALQKAAQSLATAGFDKLR